MRVVAHNVVLGGVQLSSLDEVGREEVFVVSPQCPPTHPLNSSYGEQAVKGREKWRKNYIKKKKLWSME